MSPVPPMNAALRATLDPLVPLIYGRDDVVEVSLNGPGDLWVEIAGRGYEKMDGAGLDLAWSRDLCDQLKNLFKRPYDPNRFPLLASPLPGGHRLQAVLGANTRSGMVLSIRVQRHKSFDFSDFGLLPGRPVEGGAAYRAARFDSGHPIGSVEDLEAVVAAELPVLVSGGTNSGKTNFLKRLLRCVRSDRRVVTVEDVEELVVAQPNQAGLLAEESQTGTAVEPMHLLKAVLRLNPSVAVPGEQQLENTLPSYRLLNTGHSGWMSTIHADSPLDALEAWRTNMTMALKSAAAADAALPVLVRKIARIVQLSEQRKVVEIVRPADLPWRELIGRSGGAG